MIARYVDNTRAVGAAVDQVAGEDEVVGGGIEGGFFEELVHCLRRG